MDNDAFRRHGYAVIDWLADYFERVESLPVQSRAAPGELRLESRADNTAERLRRMLVR